MTNKNAFLVLNHAMGKSQGYKLPDELKFMYEGKEYRIKRKSSPQFITLHGWGNNDFVKDNKRIYDMVRNKETKANPYFGQTILVAGEFTHFIHEYLVEHILRFYNVDESIINSFTFIDYHNITRIPINKDYLEFHIKTHRVNVSKFVKMYGEDDEFLHRHLDDDKIMLPLGKTKKDITKIGLNYGNDMWINREFLLIVLTWIKPEEPEKNTPEWIVLASDVMGVHMKMGQYHKTNWYSFYEEHNANKEDTERTLKSMEKHECSICLDDIHNTELYRTTCNHHFHKKCIRDYFFLNRCDKCPDCRDLFRISTADIPKKTIKKYRKLLIPLIQNNAYEYIEFFKKHYIVRFDDLVKN
jgi:hypothetical protein